MSSINQEKIRMGHRVTAEIIHLKEQLFLAATNTWSESENEDLLRRQFEDALKAIRDYKATAYR